MRPEDWLETLRSLPRKYLAVVACIAVLLPFGGYAVISLFVPFNREIAYASSTVYSMCGLSGMPRGRQCVGRVELVVGNTGRVEVSVRLAWPRPQGQWSRSQSILNIAADRPRDWNPVIACAEAGDRLECTIDRFAPGALVILDADCRGCSDAEIESLAADPVRIETLAHVSYGDPRVTLLLRRLLAFARLFA